MKKIFSTLILLIALVPAFAQSSSDFMNRGYYLMEQDRLDDALACFNKAIEMETTKPENQGILLTSYVNKGQCLVKMKNYTEAQKAFAEVVKRDPKEFSHVFYYNAQAKQNSGDMGGAIADLTDCLKYDPENQDALYLRAMLQNQQGKSKEACADLQQAISLGHPDAKAASITICK